MFTIRYRSLLVIMLFQSIVLWGAEAKKYRVKKKLTWITARQQLRAMCRNNDLLEKSNKLASEKLTIAGEMLKALQEQNRIHMMILMQNDAAQQRAHDPISPTSSCVTPLHGAVPLSARGTALFAARAVPITPNGNAAAAAAGNLSTPSAKQRLPLSLSSPSLQHLEHAAGGAHKTTASLPTIISPVNAEGTDGQTAAGLDMAGAAGGSGSGALKIVVTDSQS